MDLMAFGRVFLEIVFGQVPSLPGPGEEIFADEFAISCGGAVTVASAASHYGVQAGLSTLLSDDLGSRVVAEHCRRAGVDLSPSRHAGERTAGITVVLNFSGDRGFVSYLPPAQPVAGPDTGHFLEVLRDYRPAWCYLHPWPGAEEVIAEARSLGIRVALDVGLNAIASHPRVVRTCARRADVFLPNTEELLRLTGARSLPGAIDVALAWCRCLVVKRGAGGAIVADQAGRTAVTDGIGPSVTEAAAAGNAAGSRTVSILGAVGEVDIEGLSPAAAPLAAALLGAQRPAPDEQGGSAARAYGQEP